MTPLGPKGEEPDLKDFYPAFPPEANAQGGHLSDLMATKLSGTLRIFILFRGNRQGQPQGLAGSRVENYLCGEPAHGIVETGCQDFECPPGSKPP